MQSANRNNSLNYLLNIMYEATENTSYYVFTVSQTKEVDLKPIYNLFAESFIGVKSFCLLMNNKAWSQAAVILRTLLEQVATLFVISFYPETTREFLKFDNLRRKYYSLSDNEQIKFQKEYKLKSKTAVINYFDYGWIKHFIGNNPYGKKQLLKLAKLDEFQVDIDVLLNHFAHGKLTVFDLYNRKYGWTLMERCGKRLCLICAKLFDFLTCSYKKWVGEKMADATTNNLFKPFKIYYENILVEINKKKTSP